MYIILIITIISEAPTPADYFMNYKRQECNNFNNETIGETEPENEFTDYEYICNFINCLDEEI